MTDKGWTYAIYYDTKANQYVVRVQTVSAVEYTLATAEFYVRIPAECVGGQDYGLLLNEHLFCNPDVINFSKRFPLFFDDLRKTITDFAAGTIVTMNGDDEGSERLRSVCPALTCMVTNPESGKPGTLARVIISLNDVRGWTREEIADWLESLDLDISLDGT